MRRINKTGQQGRQPTSLHYAPDEEAEKFLSMLN
jgi:hypothetical protein